MRLAKKPVVKRIRTPRKTKMKAFEPLLLEADCETQKPAEISMHKISLQNQYEVLKIAINCMFLLNGGASVALISANISQYFNVIVIFSSGALISVALYLFVGFTNAVENLRSNKFVVKNILIIYSPLIIFMVGMGYSLFYYL